MSKNEYSYVKEMKKDKNKLNKINNQYTKAEAKAIFSGTISYHSNLKIEEIETEIDLYITYLGYLDSLIQCEKEDLVYWAKLNNNKNYYLSNKKLTYFKQEREKLIKLIKTNTKIFSKINIKDYILKDNNILNNLSNIYNENKNNRYILNFINCYTKGYKKNGYIDYNYIFNYFNKYSSLVNIHNKKNIIKLTKLRILRKEPKI